MCNTNYNWFKSSNGNASISFRGGIEKKKICICMNKLKYSYVCISARGPTLYGNSTDTSKW